MPLRDHFRPPVTDVASWDELHGAWPSTIAYRLNALLPPEYKSGVTLQNPGGSGNQDSSDDSALDWQAAAPTVLLDSWHQVEAWEHALEVGAPLPTLPLWISESQYVPLELERTYEETCRGLRIP